MKSKYLTYSIEQLADEKQFIDWVSKGDHAEKWEKLIKENPEFGNVAAEARELILLLQEDLNVLEMKDELEMWNTIKNFSRTHQAEAGSFKLRGILSWAASILVVLSMGAFAYFYLGEKANRYQFVSTESQNQSNDARLILSDGEEISLRTSNSKLSLNDDSELMLNNDTIIDLSPKERNGDGKFQMNEVIIPFGKKSELLLADGTKVWLNAGSHFAFPTRFTDEPRQVYLIGEAYFEVANNKQQAFIVYAGQIEVKVLGTRFDVSAHTDDGKIETILLEGSVTLSRTTGFGLARNEVILQPNQKASFDKRKKELIVFDEPNPEMYITWTEGMFQFSKENLPAIFTKLERFYNVEFIFSPDLISSGLISGKLDLKESLEEVMAALGDVAKITYHIEENTVYIDKNDNR